MPLLGNSDHVVFLVSIVSKEYARFNGAAFDYSFAGSAHSHLRDFV